MDQVAREMPTSRWQKCCLPITLHRQKLHLSSNTELLRLTSTPIKGEAAVLQVYQRSVINSTDPTPGQFFLFFELTMGAMLNLTNLTAFGLFLLFSS
jgi:hypothetical protein